MIFNYFWWCVHHLCLHSDLIPHFFLLFYGWKRRFLYFLLHISCLHRGEQRTVSENFFCISSQSVLLIWCEKKLGSTWSCAPHQQLFKHGWLHPVLEATSQKMPQLEWKQTLSLENSSIIKVEEIMNLTGLSVSPLFTKAHAALRTPKKNLLEKPVYLCCAALTFPFSLSQGNRVCELTFSFSAPMG